MKAGFWPLCQVTFPEPDDCPAVLLQRSGNEPISTFVSSEFFLPFFSVADWRKISSAVMSMPITSICEDDKFFRSPNEIWLPENFRVPTPSDDVPAS